MPTRVFAASAHVPVRPAPLARLCCAALLCAAALWPAAAAAEPDAAPQRAALSAPAKQFFAAVRANFARFDRDHDGTLTREEIEIEMQDPRITGEAAAALAALKLGSTRSNYLHETRSFTLADIDAMEATLLEAKPLTPNFVKYFAAGLKKQAEVPRELFAQGMPHLSAIRQDWTSDCYFLSTVGSLAHANPQALVRLIAANRDGTYTVTFPGKPPVRVAAPTDSEIATYTNAQDGIWLGLLEKAYAITRIAAEPAQASTRQPLDSVGFRTGNPGVVKILTGHGMKQINLPNKSNRPADARLYQELRAEMTAAMREHRAVMLGNAHHDYSIVGFDPAVDQITIHNPYNRGGFEGFPDGSKAARAGGFFTVTTEQLAKYFHYVDFEKSGRG
jgi:hypothetical protein